MSNFNTNTTSAQLFTDLTHEEGAAVAGGAFLYIDSIQALNAGADTIGKDDTYITVNGTKIWGDKGFSTGDTHKVEIGKPINGSTSVRLFDSDGFLNGKDDYMGGFSVSAQSTTNGLTTMTVSGGGSKYEVYYQIL